MLIKVRDLKPGQIIIMAPWRRVVLNTKPVAGGIALTVASMGDGCSVRPPEVYDPNREVVVERADLSPAQEHADELLDLLRQAVDRTCEEHREFMPAWAKLAAPLIMRIDPPIPPTAQELAVALAGAAKYLNLNVDRLDAEDRAAADLAEESTTRLLARARQAGML